MQALRLPLHAKQQSTELDVPEQSNMVLHSGEL